MFHLTDEWIGGGLIDEVSVAPATLVAVFGKPGKADEYKVSGEYAFKSDKTNESFRIYDWKVTTLYYGENEPNTPTPEEFWLSEEPHDFHIGGPGRLDMASIREALEGMTLEACGHGDTEYLSPRGSTRAEVKALFQRLFWNKGLPPN